MSKPLNIFALVPYPVYPAKMGGQKGIALFYEYLSQLTTVNLFTTSDQKPEKFKGRSYPVLGSAGSRYANPLLFFTLKNILKNNNATHLILEHPYFGWLGVMLKKACGVKLVIHSHNIESLRFKSTGRWWWHVLRKYERFTHRHADLNFFISNEDREYAITNFQLDPLKCHTITYGIEMKASPSTEERTLARNKINALHNIKDDEKVLFFNGTLSYKPNLDAVEAILHHINPTLQASKNFRYKIIICGKGLPESFHGLKKWSGENIIYAGFVDDITEYFKASSIFINPVQDGGGIKTKLVEALGYNVNGISTSSGAIGIPDHISGTKLSITADGDWHAFSQAIVHADTNTSTPPEFFQHFYWGNIAMKAKAALDADHNTL